MLTDPPTHRSRGAAATPCAAAPRICLAVFWVFCLALLPNRFWLWHLITAGALAFLSGRFQLPWVRLLRRVGLLCPFLALTGVGFLGQADWLIRLANLLIKATLSLWILTLLIHLTPFPEFVTGLRRLRFPPIWVDLFAFLFRYFSVLTDEWRRMQLARQARLFRPGRRRELLLLARSLGSLFIRAFERAERVHRAMLARGYQLSRTGDRKSA